MADGVAEVLAEIGMVCLSGALHNMLCQLCIELMHFFSSSLLQAFAPLPLCTYSVSLAMKGRRVREQYFEN